MFLLFRILLVIVLSFFFKSSPGQINIFLPESMYNGTGGINGDAISDWEGNDRFENDQLYMSGSGDVRNTFPSDYPGASGSWNIMLNNSGESFRVSGIDALSYINISIKLGIRKSTTAENGSGLLVEYSLDGFSWMNINIALPSGPGTAGWHEIQPSDYLPPGITDLRFSSISSTEFRLDDLRLMGNLPCIIQVDSVFPLTGPMGTMISITGTGFTGTNQVSIGVIPVTSFQVESDELITALVADGSGIGNVVVSGTCTSMGSTVFETIDESCELNGNNLILSELCDPVNNFQTDRYIEIFNPTSQTINLEGWTLKAIANFIECETWYLTGLIEPGEAKTCGYENPVNGGPHDFTLSTWLGSIPGSCCSSWNGNRRDGATLYNGGVKIDEVLYENTSIPWFADCSLQRKDTVCSPWPSPKPDEWTLSMAVLSAGEFPSTPGSHITHCHGEAPDVIIQPMLQTICEGQDASINVNASSGISPYVFKWMMLDEFGTWVEVFSDSHFSIMDEETESTLIITGLSMLMENIQFYCKVYNHGEGCWKASTASVINVKPVPLTSNILHY